MYCHTNCATQNNAIITPLQANRKNCATQNNATIMPLFCKYHNASIIIKLQKSLKNLILMSF